MLEPGDGVQQRRQVPLVRRVHGVGAARAHEHAQDGRNREHRHQPHQHGGGQREAVLVVETTAPGLHTYKYISTYKIFTVNWRTSSKYVMVLAFPTAGGGFQSDHMQLWYMLDIYDSTYSNLLLLA